jgi:hypothetical protein
MNADYIRLSPAFLWIATLLAHLRVEVSRHYTFRLFSHVPDKPLVAAPQKRREPNGSRLSISRISPYADGGYLQPDGKWPDQGLEVRLGRQETGAGYAGNGAGYLADAGSRRQGRYIVNGRSSGFLTPYDTRTKQSTDVPLVSGGNAYDFPRDLSTAIYAAPAATPTSTF